MKPATTSAACAATIVAVLLITSATRAQGSETYTQPIDCSFSANILGYYSNANSDLEPWIARDDFVAPGTGLLGRVSVWAGTVAHDASPGCDLLASIDGLQIDIFEADPLPDCGPSNTLWRSFVPKSELAVTPDCPGFFPAILRLDVTPPTPCHLEGGKHYLLQVSAVLTDPQGECVMFWSVTSGTINCPMVFYDRRTGTGYYGAVDLAFEIVTNPCSVTFDEYGTGL